MITILLTYLLAINLVTFVYFAADKRRARRGQWRVSEAVLLWLAAAGGAIGALLAMQVLRHKTKHWRFTILVPLLGALWTVAVVYMIF